MKLNYVLQVSTEIVEVEKLDESMQKRVIDLIIGLGITKLVMGFSFMKPSLYVNLHSLALLILKISKFFDFSLNISFSLIFN
jgi:hypothetical protein